MAHQNYWSENASEGFGSVFACLILWFIVNTVHTFGRLTRYGNGFGMRRRSATTTATVPIGHDVDHHDGLHGHSYDTLSAVRDLFIWISASAIINWISNGIAYSVMVILWVMFALGLLWILARIYARGWADFISWPIMVLALVNFCLAYINRNHVYGGWWGAIRA